MFLGKKQTYIYIYIMTVSAKGRVFPEAPTQSVLAGGGGGDPFFGR